MSIDEKEPKDSPYQVYRQQIVQSTIPSIELVNVAVSLSRRVPYICYTASGIIQTPCAHLHESCRDTKSEKECLNSEDDDCCGDIGRIDCPDRSGDITIVVQLAEACYTMDNVSAKYPIS